jgi:hypothetical protein
LSNNVEGQYFEVCRKKHKLQANIIEFYISFMCLAVVTLLMGVKRCLFHFAGGLFYYQMYLSYDMCFLFLKNLAIRRISKVPSVFLSRCHIILYIIEMYSYTRHSKLVEQFDCDSLPNSPSEKLNKVNWKAKVINLAFITQVSISGHAVTAKH